MPKRNKWITKNCQKNEILVHVVKRMKREKNNFWKNRHKKGWKIEKYSERSETGNLKPRRGQAPKTLEEKKKNHCMFLYMLCFCTCHVFVQVISLYMSCFCTCFVFVQVMFLYTLYFCTLHVFVQVGQPKKFFTKFSSNFVPAVNHHGSNLFKTLDFSSNHRFQNCHQQIL